jgi:hypothetical protein
MAATLSMVTLAVTTLGGCLPAAVDDAQNRCLVYGYKSQNDIAHCTEIELHAPPGPPPGFSRINAAQDQCMIRGYRGNALADCTQHHARDQPP